ncbi:outer membrane beta-barrel protein [Sphingobacterium kitahiroshimense]|uniref:outer membrane beta-barrel protein n=1 Tax=Sphingobacterium kitahiroshimense TaxID=470446 RepID=UPI0032085A79
MKRSKYLIIFIFCAIVMPHILVAQSQRKAQFIFRDTTLGTPIESVSVYLYKDSVLVSQEKTDRSGNVYLFLDLLQTYSIKTSHLFYETKELMLDPLDINKRPLVIVLSKKNKVLHTVSVDGVKIKHEADRTTFVVDQSKFTANSNSLDVMKRLPGISVINSEIIILGQKNIAYFYDGKEVDFDFVKLLNAKTIKKVEVIDQNVKYKEGKFVIINIVPRQIFDGYAVQLGQSIGTRKRSSSQLSLKLKKNRIIFDSNILLSSFKNSGSHSSHADSDSQNSEELYSGTRSTRFSNFNYSSNLLYEIDSLNSINLYINALRTPTKNNIVTQFASQNISEKVSSFNKAINKTFNTTLEYKKQFNPQKFFTSTFYYKSDVQDDNIELRQSDISSNSNYTNKRDLIFQVNYSSQIGSSFNWSIGSKYVNRNNTNKYNSNNDFVNQSQREDIYYFLAEGILKNPWVNVTTSLNLELYNGILKHDLEEDRKIDYNNLFYSMIFSRKIGKTNFLRLNLSRVIYRPSMTMLSMFYNEQDINIIKKGNNKLNPEIQNIARLSFNKSLGFLDINISNTFKITTDEMSPSFAERDNLTIREFINIPQKFSYIPSLDLSLQKGNFYNQLGISFTVFKYHGIDSLISNPNKVFGNLLLTNSLGLSFGKSWSADANIMYESGMNAFQTKTKGYTYGDISLNKEIKKFKITLEYLDVFNKSSNFINTIYLSKQFHQQTWYNSNVVRFKVSYSFGKEFNINSSNSIRNQDVKDIK